MVASQQQERVSLFQEEPMGRDLSRGRAPTTLKDPTFNYKPIILRTVPLLALLLLSVLFIGLLQYAVGQLPHGNNRLAFKPPSSNAEKRDLVYVFARNNSTQGASPTSSATSGGSSSSSGRADNDSSAHSSSSSSTSDRLRSRTSYLSSDKTTMATMSDTAYVKPTKMQTVPGTSTTQSSAYVDPLESRTSTPQPSAQSTAFVDPTETIALSTNTDAYINTEDTLTLTGPTNTPSPITTTFLVVITSSSAILRPVSSETESDDMTATTDTGAYISTHQTASAAMTGYVPVVLTLTITSTSSPSASEPTDSSTPNTQEDGTAGVHGKPTVVVFTWSQTEVFLGTYLAVLLAVIYRILFNILHKNLTLIDPFRQLMDPDGAPAENAFFAFYQNQSSLLGPIPALRKGRWTLAWVGTGYLAACLLPALASEAIWVDTNWDCPLPDPNDTNNPCPARLTASIAVLRALQGLLAFAAAVILGLASLLLIQKTGLPADPSSISTISSLMRHPGMAEDLNAMPVGPGANLQNMKQSMGGRRYGMGTWKNQSDGQSYGIRPVAYLEADDAPSNRSTSLLSKSSGDYAPVDARSSFDDADITAHRFIWMDFLLTAMVMGTFGVVLAYYLDGSSDGFNNWFSSNTFGPRFILTGAGTVIANMWNEVEQSSVVMAPFMRLSKRRSPPSGTLSFAPSTTPILSTWRTLRAGYFFAAAVTVTTLLGETLNIVISGVPFATGQTWKQFLVSAYLSMAILSVMMIISILVIWHRKHEPRIPVHPDTLASKMSYLAGAWMLDDFEGSEFEKQKTRDERLRLLRKKYEFRPTVRKDGRRTWLVDETHDHGGSHMSI